MASSNPSRESPNIGDGARHGCGRRSERTREKRPATFPLSPLEVAIARAHRALTGSKLVSVHRDAHRAPRFAPLRASLHENPVEPLCFGGAFHGARAGNDEHSYTGGDTTPTHYRRRLPQVRDSRVGAASDEHDINRVSKQRLAWLERHVAQRLIEIDAFCTAVGVDWV